MYTQQSLNRLVLTGLADGLVISRAGLEFGAGKLLVLPQPLGLGGQDGQDCSRLLEVNSVEERPGVSSEGRKEGKLALDYP